MLNDVHGLSALIFLSVSVLFIAIYSTDSYLDNVIVWNL